MQTDIRDAIRAGAVRRVREMLAADGALAKERLDGQRTLLHVATDWPGHFPNVGETIAVLVKHGADVNAPFQGKHQERPLHWAASSDDVEALDALLEHGADVEATGAVIGGGTALADAVGFGQWAAARRLVERGAKTTIWQAAALGMVERVEECMASGLALAEINNALWNACNGGQLAVAQFLVGKGADLDCVGHDGVTPRAAGARNGNVELVGWLRSGRTETV